MYEAAKQEASSGQRVCYFADRDSLIHGLETEEDLLPEGCTILVKASHGMEFSKVVDFLRAVR